MKIQRSRNFVDTLELEDGENLLDIPVDINLERMAPKIRAARVELINAEKKAKEAGDSPEAIEAYGKAIVGLFEVVFGEDNTQKILDFYDGQYTDMLADVVPYLIAEVFPAMLVARNRKILNMKAARNSAKRMSRVK